MNYKCDQSAVLPNALKSKYQPRLTCVLVYNVRKHLSLSHWVYSQLKTLRHSPVRPLALTGTCAIRTDQCVLTESHLTPDLITAPRKARHYQENVHSFSGYAQCMNTDNTSKFEENQQTSPQST